MRTELHLLLEFKLYETMIRVVVLYRSTASLQLLVRASRFKLLVGRRLLI